MNWTEICNRDIKLMKEFKGLFYNDVDIENMGIKGAWGHIVCFAETKGIQFEKSTWSIITKDESPKAVELQNVWKVLAQMQNPLPTEEEFMLWCAEKFFKECK